VPAVWAAGLVHLFTGLGAVCALLAVLAIRDGAWEAMFAWLAVALVIDGVDGTLARRLQVKSVLPRYSGDRLDLIIDYLTYVFVPALALAQGGYLQGSLGILMAALILLSSLVHFADTESKAADNAFIGFPAVWNVVAFYIFAFDMPGWLAVALCAVLVVLTFAPFRWPHPVRTAALRSTTLLALGAWSVAGLLSLVHGFPAPLWAQAILAATALYGAAAVAWIARAPVPPR
jgi:phosphatidylcholine synthase